MWDYQLAVLYASRPVSRPEISVLGLVSASKPDVSSSSSSSEAMSWCLGPKPERGSGKVYTKTPKWSKQIQQVKKKHKKCKIL